MFFTGAHFINVNCSFSLWRWKLISTHATFYCSWLQHMVQWFLWHLKVSKLRGIVVLGLMDAKSSSECTFVVYDVQENIWQLESKKEYNVFSSSWHWELNLLNSALPLMCSTLLAHWCYKIFILRKGLWYKNRQAVRLTFSERCFLVFWKVVIPPPQNRG